MEDTWKLLREHNNSSKFVNNFENIVKNSVTDIKLSREQYNKLSNFYVNYNWDNRTKSIDDKYYRILNFKYTKIISDESLYKVLSKYDDNINKSEHQYSYDEDYKHKPISWKRFYSQIEQSVVDKSNNGSSYIIKDEKLNNILKDLEIEIKEKKFDFKYYQNLHKRTQISLITNLFNNLILATRDPHHDVIKSKRLI